MSLQSSENRKEQNRLAARKFVLVGTVAEAVLGITGLVGGWLLGIPIREYVQWELSDVGKGLVATLPMLFILGLVEFAPGRAFRRLRALVDLLIAPLIRSVPVPELGLVSLAAGLGEEVFFRGLVQGALVQVLPVEGLVLGMPWEGPFLAILLASLVFGLAHPLSSFYVVLTTIMGIYLGILFHWSGNLLIPIVAHAVYDFVALVYLARYRRRGSPGS